MRGGEWVVPVVVLLVWVVSTILKSREQNEPVRAKPGAGGEGRKPTGDIDKFLQEIDRLRRKSADEQGQTVRPVPQVRPVPPPIPRVRAVPRVRPVSRPAEMLAAESVPAVTPVSTPVASEFVAPIQFTKPLGVAQVSMMELRQSPGVTAALHLLRSPRTLAAAVVLQEVLGPPKCKQQRGNADDFVRQ
jgi:hypothetical protein